MASRRRHEEDIRETHARTLAADVTIQERTREMAELSSKAAELKSAAAAAAAGKKGPAAAEKRKGGAAAGRPRSSSSGGGGKSGSRSDVRAAAAAADAGGSPRSNMSSPWGTDVSAHHACMRAHMHRLPAGICLSECSQAS